MWTQAHNSDVYMTSLYCIRKYISEKGRIYPENHLPGVYSSNSVTSVIFRFSVGEITFKMLCGKKKVEYIASHYFLMLSDSAFVEFLSLPDAKRYFVHLKGLCHWLENKQLNQR